MRLYLHWPFCVSRCAYCDFNSRVAAGGIRLAYRRALTSEMRAWSDYIGEATRSLQSIYLGGGTPSTMSGGEIAGLLSEVLEDFRLEAEAEITVEVNPGDWSLRDFMQARGGGVSRFSIGIQSLDDGMLKILGRRHDASEAMSCLGSALDSGAAVSVDLLCALPAGGSSGAAESLAEVLAFRPHHISVYALTVEEGTPLSRWVDRGEIILPAEEEAAGEYLALVEMLEPAGYGQYEIANFCLPGYESRHNMGYWLREDYLGMGAGAHSMTGKCRFSNTKSILDYMKQIGGGQPPIAAWEALDADDEAGEEIMLGLRTSGGVRSDLIKGHEDRVADLEATGLLERRPGGIRLTPRGMLVSNSIIIELMPASSLQARHPQ